MFKVIELLLGITTLWWIGYIFVAGDASERIDRTCAPIEVVFGRFVSSGTDLAMENSDDVRGWFHKANYSCRYMVWNQFYGEDWRNAQHKTDVRPAEVEEVELVPTGKLALGIDGKPLPSLPVPRVLKPSAAMPLDGVPPPEKRLPAGRETKLLNPPQEVGTVGRVRALEQYQVPAKRPADVAPAPGG
jgi:hypothetical protein